MRSLRCRAIMCGLTVAQLATLTLPWVPESKAMTREGNTPSRLPRLRSLLVPEPTTRRSLNGFLAAMSSTAAAEEPDSAAVVADPAAALERASSDLNRGIERKSSWWVWAGSAALVGLFVAGVAHDLSRDEPVPVEPSGLPDFPHTP